MIGMKINTMQEKTEVVMISRHPVEFDIYIVENKLSQSDYYTHIGVNVRENHSQEVEINNRMAKYNSHLGMVYPLLTDLSDSKEV